MTDTAAPNMLRTGLGVLLGMLAVLGWGIYNVGAEIGQAQGFRPADLTMLRFGVGALVLLPWFLWRGWRLNQRRLVILALVVGPVFAMMFNAGFRLAPLAHAVVIGPGMSVLMALFLVRVIDGQRISLRRMLALGLLVAGLVVIGLDRGAPKSLTGSVLLGDLCFIGSGSLWGLYSYLLGRWKMPPVETTAGVALYASVVFVPLYLIVWGIPDLGRALWLEQALYQGLIGGSGALVAFAGAVSVMG
ncbi:MAG: DMT family transporter, partial [Gemmobacter sp.]|nr:DMT family transporter [Gemmobacter sp.]